MTRIVDVTVTDVRFPTSELLDGSDAMHPDPDYSAAYVVLRTSEGPDGHGFVFTLGRGTDIQVAALRSLGEQLVGRDVEALCDDLGGLARELTGDSQVRWLGPDKGVVHMAAGALVNATWDLAAKRAGLPLWRLLASLTPEEVVDLVDFTWLTDELTREQALEILRAAEPGKAERVALLAEQGLPAYTTTPGWLGYDDDKLARLCREAVEAGFGQIKLKVGADLDDDRRRLKIARDVVGPDVRIAVDANQRWEVGDAIRWVEQLREFDLAWVEEPTSPDDVLGHAKIARAVAPVPVATGEHAMNKVLFKQLLAADAIGVCQIDATRVCGVNENVAILLLAAQRGVPVCPHAGGVGLCELVQHLSAFDVAAVSGRLDGQVVEFADHLHEHFVTPARVEGGRYRLPETPGFSAEMRPESLQSHAYPHGKVWSQR